MFEPFCTYKPKLEENLPESEDQETMTYYVYGEEAVILFLNEYNQFKSVHKNAGEFRSIAMYSDENRKNSKENPSFNNFITLEIICAAIKHI